MTGWRWPARPPSRNAGHSPPSSLLRGSTTPCQYLLRIARSSGLRRASEPTSEPASVCARSVRSPKNLLCRIASSSTPICSAVDSADSSFSSSLVAAAAAARRSAKLCSRMSSSVGGTSSSIWWRRSSSAVRNRTISASLLLVGDHRDPHEVEPPLQRRGQVVDAAVAAVGGGDDGEAGLGEDDVVVVELGDGDVLLGQDRDQRVLHVAGGAGQLLEAADHALLHRGHDRRRDHRLAGLARWRSPSRRSTST